MAQKLSAGMPSGLHLGRAYTIRFCALSPTTGAAVSGVNVSLAQIHADAISTAGPLDMQQLAVEPIWVPIPLDQQ